MRRHFYNIVAAVVIVCVTHPALALPPDTRTRNENCIQPYAENPFYWQYKGKPAVLLGGSVEDNLFQIPNLEEHLNLLAKSGGNYVRNTLSSRDEENRWPFFQRDDGKYDLEIFDDTYYERLQRLLELTYSRNIIVQFEMWDRFDYARDEWVSNPFRPVNNINYTVESSGLKNHYPRHPGSNDNPFFRSVPEQDNNEVILRFQQRHIDRVLEISLPYPNVLYCMDNETAANADWGAYWSRYIKRKAEAAGVIVQTTEMWDDWNLQAPRHRNTLDHPELYSFIDVSQNNHQKGQKHWDNLQWVRRYLENKPRPINHVKAYGSDSEQFGNSRDGVERFWRSLIGGAASIRFHRPTAGLGLGEIAQANIRSARMFANVFDLWTAAPTTAEVVLDGAEANEVYVTAITGKLCAIYFPSGGEVTLRAWGSGKALSIRWLDIEQPRWMEEISISAAPAVLQTPTDAPWVALISLRR